MCTNTKYWVIKILSTGGPLTYVFPALHEPQQPRDPEKFEQAEQLGQSDDSEGPRGLDQGRRDFTTCGDQGQVVEGNGGGEVDDEPALQVSHSHHFWAQHHL